jgi:hypothetical protein
MAFADATEEIEKAAMVVVIGINAGTRVTAGSDVIERAGVFQTQRAGHASKLSGSGNGAMLTLNLGMCQCKT